MAFRFLDKLKQKLNSDINANGRQEITGSVANSVLTDFLDSLMPYVAVNSKGDINNLDDTAKKEGYIYFVRGDEKIKFFASDGSTLLTVADEAFVNNGLSGKQNKLTNSDSQIQTAVNQASHSNRSILDQISAAFTTALLNKLNGIQSNATQNSTDSTLFSRSNHTGTQPASTISNFNSAVSGNSDVSANTTHRNNTSNPHSVTRAQLGFGQIKTITSDDTITESDETILVDASSGNVTVTLADPTNTESYIYNIKKIDSSSNTVTFSTSSGTIEFGNNIDLTTQGEVVNLQHNGIDYFLIA